MGRGPGAQTANSRTRNLVFVPPQRPACIHRGVDTRQSPAEPSGGAPLRLARGSALWPAEFENIEGVPQALWCLGRREWLSRRPCVAIVGTRAPTPYGQAQAARFARAFASAGAVVVSGLARGIDHAAHEAALEVGGATIAVLGSSVDRPWPESPLVDRMLEHGLLISEFEPGTAPRRHHFPLRNRLIAGLSQYVLVVEAAYASGSLITARWAIDQGKQVGALPGRIDHPMARGCHRLLREGALLVESPEEVLGELGLAAPGVGTGSGEAPGTPASESTAAPKSALLALLVGETLGAEELSERSGRALPEVLVELVELELAGRVWRLPGGLYRLA
ncbi:MAG: DNA-protecting protein DprA [Planctomycetes bacterium]|nr:DNA-protecting protein DprA [Planctomycetota bacterium]